LAIKGSLVEASLPEVIQLLSYSGKSGCLSVTDGTNLGNIFLKEGRIVYATMINRKVRLGDTMVEENLIHKHMLDEALRLQKEMKKRVGEILIELGAISRKCLEEQLKQQIEETIFTMLSWQSGYFNFEENLLPASGEYTIDISAQELLLAGARRIRDWQRIEGKLPPFETVLLQSQPVPDLELTEIERKVLAQVDGSRNIDELIKESGLEFYEACRVLFVLLAAGVVEKPKKPAEKKREAGDMADYKNIGFALYKTAKYDEAEREFKKVLDSEPDNAEALFYLGLIEMMRGNENSSRQYLDRSIEVEQRLSTLVNIGYLCTQKEWYDDAVQYLEQAKAIEPENTKVLMNLGITYYKCGEFDEAADSFLKILELSESQVTPYVYLSLIALKQGDRNRAQDWLEKALDKFPRAVSVKNNLALLYESVDKYEDAERLYCQALMAQPDALIVLENLAHLYFRLGIYGAAREYYERIPGDRCDFSVLFNLGRICLSRGEKKEALSLWDRARDIADEDEYIDPEIDTLRVLMSNAD
jgi:tetratricopeptide (TPR) repeat protein